ncbi:MAG: o-succinylbenzoate synthase [Candidatus Margulisiibacteriota bacterium]
MMSRFSIPLPQALPVGGHWIHHREGLYWQLNKHLLELSPLPGLSPETPEQLLELIQNQGPLQHPNSLSKALPSTLRFALEWAWINHQSSLADFFEAPRQTQPVPIHALLSGDAESIQSQFKAKWKQGFRTFKLKVGRLDPQTEIELLKNLSTQHPAHFRLDANQGWTYEEALFFCQKTLDLNIDYIEEPTPNSTDTLRLYRKTGRRFALDESPFQPEILNSGAIKALIVRAALQGGLQELKNKLPHLKNNGIDPIISSGYETQVETEFLLQIAQVLAPTTCSGLGAWIHNPDHPPFIGETHGHLDRLS